jgi:septum formation protein
VTAKLVLASASPRRALILRNLGVPFRVVVSNVDETLEAGETPRASAERLAVAKAEAVARAETLPVLGADTMVVVDGAVLGKPRSAEDAASMLRRLAGRDHEVLSGLCLVRGSERRSGVQSTTVRFAAMTDAEIAAYVATEEPMDKAGGYHIDGRGSLFVESVIGSPSNVAGLPVRLLLTLSRELGVRLTEEGP